MNQPSVLRLAIATIVAGMFCAVYAQQLPPGMKLDKVEVQGSSMFTPAEVARMSGLKTGQDVDLVRLEKAVRTLADWGYFSSIRFSYKYVGTNLTVTFQLQDESKLYAYVLDNFLNVRDEEILEIIRKDYPSFSGKVPDHGAANQYIIERVEALLRDRGTPDTVSFSPVTARNGQGRTRIVFRQTKSTPICGVRLQGVSGAVEPDLVAASAKFQNQSYSREGIAESFDEALLPVAKKHGYWRLELLETKPVQDASCTTGTTVLLRLGTGALYSWGSAIWGGNQQQTGDKLDGLAGMKRGEPANLGKIEAGLSSVTAFYWSSGFLDFVMTPRPEQDDQRHEVNYRVQIKEGDQYRMGEFLCAIPPADCTAIKGKWKLKAGDLLNGAELDQFRSGPFADWKKQSSPPPGLVFEMTLQKDTAKKAANVYVYARANR
jgi:outer membrane protein assembly factor BamA